MGMQKRTKLGHFKKGTHWRSKNHLWNKKWLKTEYITKQRSMSEISKDVGVKESAVYYWMKKHNIKARNTSTIRKIKHWGSIGEKNPMWGKRGKLNPNWKGGFTPDRQLLYSSIEWKNAISEVWVRDNNTCQMCKKVKNSNNSLDIHHIIPYACGIGVTDPNNLILLCKTCHQFVHSSKNNERLFLNNDISKNDNSYTST